MLEKIENMKVEELKAARGDLIKEAALIKLADNATPEELATRYIQAITDAKIRDETLAIQGKTIITLNDAADASKLKLEEAQAAIAELLQEKMGLESALAQEQKANKNNVASCQEENRVIREEFKTVIQALQTKLDTETQALQVKLGAETQRSAQLSQEATSNRKAIREAYRIIGEAIDKQAVSDAAKV